MGVRVGWWVWLLAMPLLAKAAPAQKPAPAISTPHVAAIWATTKKGSAYLGLDGSSALLGLLGVEAALPLSRQTAKLSQPPWAALAQRGFKASATLEHAVESPDIALFAHLPRLLGYLSRGQGGAHVAQAVFRLGLRNASALVAAAQSAPLWGVFELQVPKDEFEAGLGHILVNASALTPQAIVPDTAKAALFAKVYPDKAWLLLERLAAGRKPLEYSLWRVHMDAIEAQMGVSWTAQVLGTSPAGWWVYSTDGAKGGTTAVIGVQNGLAAPPFIAAMVEGLRVFFPRISLIGQGSSQQIVGLLPQTIHLVFERNRIVVSSAGAFAMPKKGLEFTRDVGESAGFVYLAPAAATALADRTIAPKAQVKSPLRASFARTSSGLFGRVW